MGYLSQESFYTCTRTKIRDTGGLIKSHHPATSPNTLKVCVIPYSSNTYDNSEDSKEF